jgi:hypothetical protein
MAARPAASDAELLESIRLLHERLSRIEALATNPSTAIPSLPTKWNPFSGASKSELERLAALESYRVVDEQIREQHARALVLHDSLFQNIYERIRQLQARAGLPPTPPPQYAPQTPPIPAWPVQPAYPSAPPAPAPAYPIAPAPVPAYPVAPEDPGVVPAALPPAAAEARFRRRL